MGQEKRPQDSQNINDILGKKKLTAAVMTKIYSPIDIKSKYGYVNINIANKNISKANVSIYISSEIDPVNVTDDDLIEYNISLQAEGGNFNRNNFLIGANETIYVLSDVNDVIVRVDGTIFRK